jgi:ribonuclease P protein component
MASYLALTRRSQYLAVYELGKAFANRVLVLKYLQNDLPSTRLGYSVTKEIGKAVQRNHIKRWLKEATRTLEIKAGWDIVVIARRSIAVSSFREIRESLARQLRRAELLESNV